MSRLDDFIGKGRKESEDLVEISKKMSCITCNEFMSYGFFNEMKMEFLWVCSEGHESRISI